MNITNIMAYKSVYALSTLNEKTRRLKATHLACCLVGGPSPVWGVWTITGRFVRFHPSRESIANEYPKLVWRRKMSAWQMQDDEDHRNVKQRVAELEERYKMPVDRRQQ